ncbi:BglG family transcription antiterminator [Lentibacillus sediminis]|uniref:BglG family transcription antiterminator n=1 Tax=Lentibacillus sediminis TaxID=1940529 RepID=UPI00130478F8|nr:BglG family transcription antiterminator [Lentibacillus sediminis]
MNHRNIALLNQLIKSDAYVSVEELAVSFNVSRRTIYNDMDKINDWLKERGLQELRQVRGKGLYLDETVKNKLLDRMGPVTPNYYEYSPQERRAWIYVYLTGQQQPCFLDDLKELLQVSRNTIIEDIKQLKKEVEKEHLQLVSERKSGYTICGEENDLRRLLIHYIALAVPEDVWYQVMQQLETDPENESTDVLPFELFDLSALSSLKVCVNGYEAEVEIEITEDVRIKLVLWFYLFIQRIKQEKFVDVDPAEKEVIRTTEEFEAAVMFSSRLARYLTVSMPSGEIFYFAKYLLSAKVNYNLNLQLENKEMKKLTEVVEKIVYDFQVHAAVAFPDQKKMIHQLLLHLKPTYYRIKYGIRVENLLKDAVKTNYPEIFHLTKKVIHPLQDLMDQEIDDNEIAYIAMHFGGWFRREGVMLDAKRRSLLIVCTTGLGTSRLLENQLEDLFTDVDIARVSSLKEYESIHNIAVDFIVSTISLPDRGIPVFEVNPVLNNEEKENLLRRVNSLFGSRSSQQAMSVDTVMDMMRRYGTIQDEDSLRYELRNYFASPVSVDSEYSKPGLLELLPENRIAVQDQAVTWEQAIYQAAEPLQEQGFITSTYVQGMIRMVEKNGPYIVISDRIALPHAAPTDGAKKTGMSLLYLKNDVDVCGKPVRIWIVLASADNQQHLKALSQLTRLFTSRSAKDEMMQITSKARLLEWLHTHVTE